MYVTTSLGLSTAPEVLSDPSPDQASYAGRFTDPNLGDIRVAWVTDHLTIDIPLLWLTEP